jgi:long-chain acyl-CoA synthetase
MLYANLVEMQEKCCLRYADRPLYGTRTPAGYRWTDYRDFARQVDALRAGLASLGIGDGDTVAIIANNCVEWAVAAYATYSLCARYVPMYESLLPHERDYILADSDARLVFVRNSDIAADLQCRVGQIGRLQHVVAFSAAPGCQTLAELMRPSRPGCKSIVTMQRDAIAGLVYTSGTTGTPKGVIITHGNLLAQIEAVSTSQEVHSDDRSLSILPWGHLMGQIVEVHLLVYLGISAALLDDVANLARDIAVARPTILFAVPRVFTRIYDGVEQSIAARGGIAQWLYKRTIQAAVRRDASVAIGILQRLLDALADRLILQSIRNRLGGRLRFVVSGAAALSPEVIRFFDLLGVSIFEGYGLTETTMAVTSNARDARRIGSVGRCLSCAQIKLDHTVAAGQSGEGEIVVYGPCISPGYHKLPQETAAAMTPDGGLRTGDIGRFDADGFLYITGRIKEIYKLENGKYVAPAPLEETLQRSPLISQVMVYGDNQDFNIAVVVPDLAALKGNAACRGVDFSAPDWNVQPSVVGLYETEIAVASADFRHFEQPHKVWVCAEEWTVANGLLTPTLKMKRRRLVERYRSQIDQLYAQ